MPLERKESNAKVNKRTSLRHAKTEHRHFTHPQSCHNRHVTATSVTTAAALIGSGASLLGNEEIVAQPVMHANNAGKSSSFIPASSAGWLDEFL
jgi:hypothetical protein